MEPQRKGLKFLLKGIVKTGLLLVNIILLIENTVKKKEPDKKS